VVSDKSVLTSKEGFYYGETKDVYFKKDVVMVNPDYTVKTDTLLFNTYTNVATFIVPTEIVSGKRKIFTTDGYYDMANKKAYFGKRPHIIDSTTILDADEVAFNDTLQESEASGNVVYKDTAQGVTIFSNNLKSKGNESSVLATQRPVMVIKQDKDSIYIAADTFFSSKLSALRKYRNVPVIVDSVPSEDDSVVVLNDSAKQDSAKDRYIEAYYHVKIYSDSMQAVGDSLFYSSEDSAFRLFKNPVVWSRESQVSGDTIYIYTLNKKAKRMYVFENALSIQKVGPDYYNQVKGRTINGYFIDGDLNHVRVKGNSESIYYAQDDSSKFIGVNRATADVIDMYFSNHELQKVVFRSNLQGTSYPMRQMDPANMRLRSFQWLDDRRPKTKYELFGN
jgi:lipopolysaccharide export system protein LptA